MIRSGARGYVTKTISGPELVDAVQRVAGGDAVFSPRLAGFVLDAFASMPGGAVGRGLVRPRARPAHRARARGDEAHRPRATPTRRPRASCRSPSRPSRATCRRCFASCSCRRGTSSRGGRLSEADLDPPVRSTATGDPGLVRPTPRGAQCQRHSVEPRQPAKLDATVGPVEAVPWFQVRRCPWKEPAQGRLGEIRRRG